MIRPFRYALAAASGTMLLLVVCATARSQELSAKVTPSTEDKYAASLARNARHHGMPANTPAGKARPKELSTIHSVEPVAAEGHGQGRAVRYPADLQYLGGPVVTSAQQHLIYVNLDKSSSCSTVATCWGDPHGLLHDLGQSRMIHIVDQYTGGEDGGRYTVPNATYPVDYPSGNPYSDNDMLAIIHGVVTTFNLPTGYGNIYHVFLVPGQDECFNNPDGSISNVCYSPDKPQTFFFCAYHGSADFQDIGHVLYSVEPFQDVLGCSVRPGTPNGQLVDSTNDVLSHETFETITDPDGSAWVNVLNLNNNFAGPEIGDECIFLFYVPNGNNPPLVYSDPSNVILNGKRYAIQTEENNFRHACTNFP